MYPQTLAPSTSEERWVAILHCRRVSKVELAQPPAVGTSTGIAHPKPLPLRPLLAILTDECRGAQELHQVDDRGRVPPPVLGMFKRGKGIQVPLAITASPSPIA